MSLHFQRRYRDRPRERWIMLNPIVFAIGSTILLLLTVLWHYMLRGIIVDSSDTVTVYYSLSIRVLITVCTLFLDFVTFYRQGTIMVYKTPFVKLLWIVLLSFLTVAAMECWTFFDKIKKEEGCLVYRSCSLALKCQSVQLSNITKIDLYNRNGIVITYMNHQRIKKLLCRKCLW